MKLQKTKKKHPLIQKPRKTKNTLHKRVKIGGSGEIEGGEIEEGGGHYRNKIKAIKDTKNVVCSEKVSKNTRIENTCLTPDILILIKDEFNKINKTNKITSTDTKGIWDELNEKMKCNIHTKKKGNHVNYHCWIIQIQNKKIRDKIITYIFAPKHPKSWNTNQYEWLSNIDILEILEQYETTHKNFKLFKPTSIDFDFKVNKNQCVSNELCNIDIVHLIENGKTEFGFIFNLDKHTQSGSHWVSMYCSFNDNFIFFFDSVGNPIPKEIKVLKDRIVSQIKDKYHKTLIFEQNTFEHQKKNTECGVYSLYLVISMLERKINNKPVNYKKLINYFKGDKRQRITDDQINNIRLQLFNSPNHEVLK